VLALGAVLEVTRDGEPVVTLTPKREYFGGSSGDPSTPIRNFFEGEPTSEVGRDESLTRDLWTAMQPDLSSFDAQIDEVDENYAAALAELSPELRDDPEFLAIASAEQGRQILALADRYMTDTPPAEIRFNVNPFVSWFWLGVLVGVGGALFALWPSADGRRRRVTDVYGARLARELTSV